MTSNQLNTGFNKNLNYNMIIYKIQYLWNQKF